jgi:hypothetical protein
MQYTVNTSHQLKRKLAAQFNANYAGCAEVQYQEVDKHLRQSGHDAAACLNECNLGS